MPQQCEFLTVREVMTLLRLGRTTVYAQARMYLATGGEEGIPCRKFGRSLRFPAEAVRRYAGLTPEPPSRTPRAVAPPRPSRSTGARRPAPTGSSASHSARRSQSRRTASARADDTLVQPALPFTD
jgi:hypothetical protein